MLKKLALASSLVLAISLAALAATPLHTYNNSVGTEQETIGVHCINNTTGEPESCSTAAGPSGGLSESDFDARVGEVQTTPTANTLLRRLKDLLTGITLNTGSNVIGGVTMADGASTTMGAKADAKSTATDTTAITAMQVWKQISASVQSLVAQLPSSLGAKTTANSLSVAPASDLAFGSAVTLTRPATTPGYSANDVVKDTGGAALSFTLGAGAGQYMITSASLEIDAAAIISGETSYILELYNVTPPSAYADDAAWDLGAGDRASYLGEVQLGAPADKGSTLFVETNGINKQITTASASVFAYLVTVGAHTSTASRVYVITLHTALVH